MPNQLQVVIEHTCDNSGGVISIVDYNLDTAASLSVSIRGRNNGIRYDAYFPEDPLPYQIVGLPNEQYYVLAVNEFGRSASVKINGDFSLSTDIFVDCAPPQPDSDLALTLETQNPTTIGGTEGSVTFVISGSNGPFKTRIGVLDLVQGKTYYDGLSAGTYLAYVEDSTGAMVQLPFTLVGPPPIFHTEPQAKYLAVGGVLPNEINYHFNFNLFDELGNRKESHYVQLDLYREDETQPFASTRARLKDALATVDVSRYIRNIVKIAPPPSAGMISPDNTAMKRFHVKYQEYAFGVAVGEEVTTEEKYAVNAALQDLQNNDYSDFVIFE